MNSSPSIIPAVSTDHQKLALGLFREAGASNNDYLAFLFYWHVIETGSEMGAEVVDRLASTKANRVNEDIAKLALGNRSLGNHLWENVRNAIAHIQRGPERNTLNLSNLEQRNEMAIAARIARRVAEAYIEHDLSVGEQQLFLMRKGRNGFPKYTSHANETDPWKWNEAYPRKYFVPKIIS